MRIEIELVSVVELLPNSIQRIVGHELHKARALIVLVQLEADIEVELNHVRPIQIHRLPMVRYINERKHCRCQWRQIPPVQYLIVVERINFDVMQIVPLPIIVVRPDKIWTDLL